MKNFVKILGVILLVAGSVLGCFSTIAVADYIAIAVDACGLALLIGSTLKKAEKKTWKEYLCIVLFAIAGFCCGFAGIADTVIAQLSTAIAAVVALITGLIVSSIKAKK